MKRKKDESILFFKKKNRLSNRNREHRLNQYQKEELEFYMINSIFCPEYCFIYNDKNTVNATSLYESHEPYYSEKAEKIFIEIIKTLADESKMMIEFYNGNAKFEYSPFYFISDDKKSIYIVKEKTELNDLLKFIKEKRIDESEFYFYDNIENNLHEFEEIKKWINEVPCKLYFLLDAQRGALTIRHNMEQKLIVKKIEDVLKNYNYRIVKDFNY